MFVFKAMDQIDGVAILCGYRLFTNFACDRCLLHVRLTEAKPVPDNRARALFSSELFAISPPSAMLVNSLHVQDAGCWQVCYISNTNLSLLSQYDKFLPYEIF